MRTFKKSCSNLFFLMTWLFHEVLSALFYAAKTNPDERHHRQAVVQAMDDMVMVSRSNLNPVSYRYLTDIQTCYNQGVIRRLSLGFLSFIWIDEYDTYFSISTSFYFFQSFHNLQMKFQALHRLLLTLLLCFVKLICNIFFLIVAIYFLNPLKNAIIIILSLITLITLHKLYLVLIWHFL